MSIWEEKIVPKAIRVDFRAGVYSLSYTGTKAKGTRLEHRRISRPVCVI